MGIVNFLLSISTEIYISVITAIILFIVQVLYSYIKDAKHSSRYRAYTGVFYLYSTSTSLKEKEVIEGYLEIKRILGKLKTKVRTANALYQGEMKFTSTNAYLYLTAKNHEEYIQIIFMDPLFPTIRKLWGVGSCISVLGEPCALRFLMSRTRYNEGEIMQIFDSHKVACNKDIFLVTKDISLYEDNAPNIDLEKNFPLRQGLASKTSSQEAPSEGIDPTYDQNSDIVK